MKQLFLGLLLFLIMPFTVSAQEPTFVSQYGCNALYTTSNPDILADYMVEILGYQPVKTTLQSFIAELPCDNLDLGRIIFNVCGITADKHRICNSWVEDFPKYYLEDFYHSYYSSIIRAARPALTTQQEQIALSDSNQQTGGFNFMHVIIVIVLSVLTIYGFYLRSMQKSTPKEQEGF